VAQDEAFEIILTKDKDAFENVLMIIRRNGGRLCPWQLGIQKRIGFNTTLLTKAGEIFLWPQPTM